jgi:hypothetical protein
MNPFKDARMVLANGDPLEQLRFGNSRQLALSESTGEFNANDKSELVRAITQLMTAVASGQVVPQEKSAIATSAEYHRQQQDRREVLAAAYNDPSGELWTALGASMALQLQEQRNREGFLRRICVGNDLKQGELARVTMTAWDAVSIVATSSANIGYQMIRNNRFQPDEFEINANLRVEQLEIEQVSGDILENVYTQGLDSIMVQEDRLWKKSADLTVGIVNPMTYISGTLTPGILASVRTQVTNWNLPASMAIISNDFWSDITGSTEFASFLDPINKYDLAMNGYLGTLVGLNLLTDAFRQPNQKVLNQGEIYVVGNPENHGAYTDRGGIRATPTSGADQGNTTKGWLMSEMFSFVLANPRSVAVAKRL